MNLKIYLQLLDLHHCLHMNQIGCKFQFSFHFLSLYAFIFLMLSCFEFEIFFSILAVFKASRDSTFHHRHHLKKQKEKKEKKTQICVRIRIFASSNVVHRERKCKKN